MVVGKEVSWDRWESGELEGRERYVSGVGWQWWERCVSGVRWQSGKDGTVREVGT